MGRKLYKHWHPSQYKKVLKGEKLNFQPVKTRTEWVDGALLVPRSLLEFALREGKQKLLATYCRWRHESWDNAGFVFQHMIEGITQRKHLAWMVKNGWVRKVRYGVYQLVAAQTIARQYGTTITAALMTKEDWKDPMSAVYGAWLSCFAKTWKNKLQGYALADVLQSEHFVVAASSYLSSILGVTIRTITNWKRRSWKLYWQKESVDKVIHPLDPVKHPWERRRGGFRVVLGPSTYFRFAIPAVKTKKNGSIPRSAPQVLQG